jgi:hypothetical protein
MNQTPVVNSDWRRNAITAATRRCTCGSSDRPSLEKMALAYFSGEGEVVEHGSHPGADGPQRRLRRAIQPAGARLPGRRLARSAAGPGGEGVRRPRMDARPGG